MCTLSRVIKPYINPYIPTQTPEDFRGYLQSSSWELTLHLTWVSDLVICKDTKGPDHHWDQEVVLSKIKLKLKCTILCRNEFTRRQAQYYWVLDMLWALRGSLTLIIRWHLLDNLDDKPVDETKRAQMKKKSGFPIMFLFSPTEPVLLLVHCTD